MDNDDYSTLIAPIRRRMVNSIWRIVRDSEETEDVLQEALLLILKRFDRIRAHPNPTALILRLCINQALDHLRRNQRHNRNRAEDLDIERLSAGTPNAAVVLMREEQRTAVFAALKTLPPREAEALLLRAVEDQPYGEVARAMGCRESTVRVLISHARKRLRALFARSDLNPVKEVIQ